MTEEFYPGYYRGVVEEVNDTQERFRYRVRVHHVHPDEIPVDNLPWSETIAFAGGSFGDVPHYEVGDRVAVIFEGGNRQYPAILGGWIASPSGVSDLPPEQDGEYAETRRRWLRIDRKGNLLELSELPEELHVRIKSGEASVTISQIGNTIDLKTTGRVNIEAEQADIKAKTVVAEGDEVTVFANARDTLGAGKGVVNLFSTKTVNIFAGDIPAAFDPFAEILIGKFTDASAVTRQSNLVRMAPRLVEIGKKDAVLPTVQVDIEASTLVRIRSNTKIEAIAPNIDINGSAEVKVQSATKVLVQSSLVEVGLAGGSAVMLDSIIAKFNAHTHPTAPSGPVSPPSPPNTFIAGVDSTVNTKAT